MTYTVHFNEIDKSSLPLVGGKGANLGEMTRAGFLVPDGFCLTTEAFEHFIQTSPDMQNFYAELDVLSVSDIDALRHTGQRIRNHLKGLIIPETIRRGIVTAWEEIGTEHAYAVRSSATAEDLPGASFAGQQETYLNVLGEASLLHHIHLCWASLFTDRAIAYRIKNSFDHRKVTLSVVIQKMIFPQVSGILFTVDPVTGNRKIITINASYGLGEALVSGIVSADLYKVKTNPENKMEICEKIINSKKVAIYGNPSGGTETKYVPSGKAEAQALTDLQIVELARVGRQIEAHYNSPQDIEWAFSEGKFYIVQSRPITSLYPVPKVNDPEFIHVLFSFGHQQMMTEALKPMAISTLRIFFPFGKSSPEAESSFMREAGSRLFIDITYLLHTSLGRRVMPKGIKNIDDLMSLAVSDFIERPDFKAEIRKHPLIEKNTKRNLNRMLRRVYNLIFKATIENIMIEANQYVEETTALNKAKLAGKSGAERIRVIRVILGSFAYEELFKIFPYAVTGILMFKMIEHLTYKWVGHTADLPSLSKSFKGNVTTEMGLELGDLAEIARPYPEVISYLIQARDKDFYEKLKQVEGGDIFLEAINSFMVKYGMRCSGEIDITQPRWREAPTQLVQAIVSHIETSRPNEHRLRFKEGEQEANEASQRILSKVRQTRGGHLKSRLLEKLIKTYRHTMALREHIKYMMVKQFDICRSAILEEAQELVRQGIIDNIEGIYYLSLAEIEDLLEKTHNNSLQNSMKDLIEERKERYLNDCKLTPPRVITSEGEILIGRRDNKNLPEGALDGQPVSAGVVEGRARVVMRPEEGKLAKGDILVAPFTDPGWTPLFISASGLVMEIGGLMTHGAVVAREYGIPAVVGVDNATKQIKDGQWIRVNGNLGYVEIIEEKML